MSHVAVPQLYSYEVSESKDHGLTVQLRGRIDATNASELIDTVIAQTKDRLRNGLTVDLEQVTYLDDFGVLVLSALQRQADECTGSFRVINVPARVQELLALYKFDAPPEHATVLKKRTPSILVRLGSASIQIYNDIQSMITFIGAVCLSLSHVIRHPKSLRTDDTFTCMEKAGVDALPIVGLISFLLGLIMAFMSAVQLRQFGANIYVASLVSLSMTRELGPIMTAIIVAGRSGSAFAAEIGTMKISDEVDALATMGFDPVRFLAVPKLIASVIVVPLLVLFSDMFAIIGGLIVGVGMLDLTTGSYIAQTIKTLALFDVFWGVFKGALFALLIAGIGCFRGFQVRGGAASVGQATTSAVVSSIFLIIVTDSLFAVILRYWG
jgi:phospholipid/cholesterol/gamma-HCH transport system permease protein